MVHLINDIEAVIGVIFIEIINMTTGLKIIE